MLVNIKYLLERERERERERDAQACLAREIYSKINFPATIPQSYFLIKHYPEPFFISWRQVTSIRKFLLPLAIFHIISMQLNRQYAIFLINGVCAQALKKHNTKSECQ